MFESLGTGQKTILSLEFEELVVNGCCTIKTELECRLQKELCMGSRSQYVEESSQISEVILIYYLYLPFH